MNTIRYTILVIFVVGNIFSGCAGPGYKSSSKSPGPVYDYPPEKPILLPDEPIDKPETTYEKSEPGRRDDRQQAFPPRIGSGDVQADSGRSDNYMLAAAASLEVRSEKLLAEGRTDQAFATAERAIRLDPDNAKLWNLLARIQLNRGNFNQAEQLSKKSNLLAKNDKRLQAKNWRIIANALARSGRAVEAEKALGKARELEKN
ncbi:MAG: tetratricopeptide repeat protein [Desulfobacterales bacterium]